MPPNAIQRQVGADIQFGTQGGKMRIACLRYRQHRAGFRISLGEPQEIMRQGFRQDHQVRLHIAWRQTRGWAGERTRPDAKPFTLAGIAAQIGNGIHCRAPLLVAAS